MDLFNAIEQMKKLQFILLLFSFWGMAQQEAYFSLSEYQMRFVNPAYAGSEAQQLFSLVSRNQWRTTPQNPKTTAMTYSTALKKNVGLGISVLSDIIFVEKQTWVTADFSYKVHLANEAQLFLGIKAGMNSFHVDTSELISHSVQIDPTKQNLSRLSPNFGVGLLYQKNQFWFSAGMPRLFNSRRSDDIELQARNRVHLYMGLGSTYMIHTNLQFSPQVYYRTTAGMPTVWEGIFWAAYQKQFKLGWGIRSGRTMSFRTKIRISEELEIAYSYDTFFKHQLSNLQMNAHEIGLLIRFNSNSNSDETTINIVNEQSSEKTE